MKKNKSVPYALIGTFMLFNVEATFAQSENDCRALPDHAALQAALDSAVATETSGLDFDMWATLVNRDGVVCAVAFSGVADVSGAAFAGAPASEPTISAPATVRAVAVRRDDPESRIWIPPGAEHGRPFGSPGQPFGR